MRGACSVLRQAVGLAAGVAGRNTQNETRTQVIPKTCGWHIEKSFPAQTFFSFGPLGVSSMIQPMAFSCVRMASPRWKSLACLAA